MVKIGGGLSVKPQVRGLFDWSQRPGTNQKGMTKVVTKVVTKVDPERSPWGSINGKSQGARPERQLLRRDSPDSLKTETVQEVNNF